MWHFSDVTWASRRLKSSATRLHVQIVQANKKEIIKDPHYWSPMSSGFPTQRASHAESVSMSISWCSPSRHDYCHVHLWLLNRNNRIVPFPNKFPVWWRFSPGRILKYEWYFFGNIEISSRFKTFFWICSQLRCEYLFYDCLLVAHFYSQAFYFQMYIEIGICKCMTNI